MNPSRQEIISWVTSELNQEFTDYAQVARPSVYLRLLYVIFPDYVRANKIVPDDSPTNREKNLKHIQEVFNALELKKEVDILSLAMVGNVSASLDLLRYIRRLFYAHDAADSSGAHPAHICPAEEDFYNVHAASHPNIEAAPLHTQPHVALSGDDDGEDDAAPVIDANNSRGIATATTQAGGHGQYASAEEVAQLKHALGASEAAVEQNANALRDCVAKLNAARDEITQLRAHTVNGSNAPSTPAGSQVGGVMNGSMVGAMGGMGGMGGMASMTPFYGDCSSLGTGLGAGWGGVGTLAPHMHTHTHTHAHAHALTLTPMYSHAHSFGCTPAPCSGAALNFIPSCVGSSSFCPTSQWM